jgi:hypothetical protein
MRQPVPALIAVLVGVTVPGAAARGQDASSTPAMSVVTLPGGVRAAAAAIGDPGPDDRSQFLLEVIRRAHETPMGLKGMPRRDAIVKPLIGYLETLRLTAPASSDSLPLPLSATIWIDVIFGGRARPDTLITEILRTPSAALMYAGLMSLDDGTRAWMATQPDLLAEIATRHASAFLIAAPGVRVEGGRLRLPGGDPAQATWEALVGRQTSDPSVFLRTLVSEHEGRLAYLLAAMSPLTPAQIRFAFNLDSSDAARADAARRLYAVFQRISEGWNIDDRPFWRPSLDPALLIADLPTAADGRPWLAGTRAFWTAVFEDGGPDRAPPGGSDADLVRSEPADFAWLAEQVFRGGQAVQRRPYYMVLFASRVLPSVTADNVRDAITAARAAGSYPALVTALERVRLADVGVYARVVRRAAQLSGFGDRGVRAIAQFSGALAFLTRAASRGSVTDDALASAMSSLAAVEPSDRGDYEGRLVRWLEKVVEASSQTTVPSSDIAAATPIDPLISVYEDAASPIDRDALRMMAGGSARAPRTVQWEGTQYRVDFAHAEMTRLSRVLGSQARPYLSGAIGVLDVADALPPARLTRDVLRQQSAAFERTAAPLHCDTGDDWTFSDAMRRCRDLAGALRRAAKGGDAETNERLAPRLRVLADDLLARFLVELAYGVALGQPEAAPISAGDAASRHDFGLQTLGFGASAPWRFPGSGADRTHDWHVTGSILGLEVRLANFSLMRLTSKPPSTRPSINDEDRRELIESVTLTEPRRLTDADLQTLVTALKAGRARAAAIRTAADADAVASQAGLSAVRRTVLTWVVTHDPDRLPTFLSPTELLWLGAGGARLDPRFHAWGTSGQPRLGCLCPQIASPGLVAMLAGRWYSGIFSTGYADLHIRLAELLAELAMPAPLLAPVLAAATQDFITNVRFRDADDRRGLIDYVHALRVDNMEQYLGLLTTDGPLVPLADGTGHEQAGRRPDSFVPLQ